MSNSRLVFPRPILVVLASLGLLFAIDLFALAAYRELDRTVEQLDTQNLALDALQPLPTMMLEMQSGLRGYLLTRSSASLNRYRAAADDFPRVVEKALALLGDDVRQRQLVGDGAASAQEWLVHFASPLVVKRSAGDDAPKSTKSILALMRNGQGEGQVDRARSMFARAIRIEHDHISRTRQQLLHELDSTASWMRGRAAALLVALAALALMLGRTLAKLTGQVRSRELAEVAMRASSATQRAMTDASPLGMFLADTSGACVQTNPAFERITGLSGSALLGNGWQTALHPDDRDRVCAAWSKTTTSDTSFASVHRFVHRNGKVVWASMKSAKMSDGNRLLGFACSIEDVSERRDAEEALRKSEERLHLALESSGLVLFDWHIPSGEVFFSREWGALTGHGAQSLTTTTRRLNELIHPEDRELLREAIVQSLKTNKAIPRTEFRIETRSGQWKRIYCSGRTTERDAVGRAVRLTGTIAPID